VDTERKIEKGEKEEKGERKGKENGN